MAQQQAEERKQQNRKIATATRKDGKNKTGDWAKTKKPKDEGMNTSGEGKKIFKPKGHFEKKRKLKAGEIEIEGHGPPSKKSYGGAVDKDGKPDWKKMRVERKALKESRKKKEMKPEIYELTKEAKALWEDMRKENCPKAVRDKLCDQIHNLIKENIRRFAFAHDLTRILESLLVHGTDAIRADIHGAFAAKEDLLFLMKSKYGHFLGLKLMKHSTKEQKDKIFEKMQPHIVSLLRHQYGSTVVNEFYSHHGSAVQKSVIIKECYGPLMRLEKVDQDLKIVLEKFPERKTMILQSLQEIITFMLEKNLKNNTILHFLMHEYLENCVHTERTEIIETMREELVNILHTNEGSLLTLSCLWHGTPKDRKVIVKSFKGFIPKIACDRHGHRVLLTMFDTIDDTVLLSKALCSEMMTNLNQLVMNDFGRRTIVYLLAHRTPLFFDPEIVKQLECGDSNEYTKKPIDSRIQDLGEGLGKALIAGIVSDFGMWLPDNSACLLVKFILIRYADEPLDDALIKIAQEIAEAPTDTGIERTAVEMLVKFILTNFAEDNRATFAETLLDALQEQKAVANWLKINRGCFALLRIWEKCGAESVAGSLVLELVKMHKKTLTDNQTSGGKLLKKNLAV